MRELIPWLIIVSLAYTNAAPPNNESQGSSADKIPNLNKFVNRSVFYVETVPESITTYNTFSCDLNLTLGDKVYNEFLRTYDHSHVILLLQVENDSKIFSVNMKNCNAKELTLDSEIFSAIQLDIAFSNDKYYVLSRNYHKQFYGIAIYDSDGKVIKAETPLADIHASFNLRMKINSKGLLIHCFGSNSHLYLKFIPYDDLKVKLLFFTSYGLWSDFSTAENKLGFCAYGDGKTAVNGSRKIICEQYDAEGKIKMISTEILIDKDNFAEYIEAENLDNGIMLKMVEWESQNHYHSKHNRVIYIDEHGKQGKRKDIDLKCGGDEYPLVQIYKNTIGEYCITHFCKIGDNQYSDPYSKCFKKSELV